MTVKLRIFCFVSLIVLSVTVFRTLQNKNDTCVTLDMCRFGFGW